MTFVAFHKAGLLAWECRRYVGMTRLNVTGRNGGKVASARKNDLLACVAGNLSTPTHDNKANLTCLFTGSSARMPPSWTPIARKAVRMPGASQKRG
jgi:hypothetical protein